MKHIIFVCQNWRINKKHKPFPKYRYFIKNILLDLSQESKVSSIDMAKKGYIPPLLYITPPPIFLLILYTSLQGWKRILQTMYSVSARENMTIVYVIGICVSYFQADITNLFWSFFFHFCIPSMLDSMTWKQNWALQIWESFVTENEGRKKKIQINIPLYNWINLKCWMFVVLGWERDRTYAELSLVSHVFPFLLHGIQDYIQKPLNGNFFNSW